ncbi:MAG: hypothetical protein KAS32_28185 [Candidatus Peribacteraceae bacterium]|nr:hypothetical protein [Candidatus Peribacteraceae bacterium]
MLYVTAGRSWKRYHGIKVVGKTESEQTVISGSNIFNIISSQGIPLDVCLSYFKNLNMVIDWTGFIDEAVRSKWNYETILKKVKYGLLDVYDEQYTEQVMIRIKYYIINKERRQMGDILNNPAQGIWPIDSDEGFRTYGNKTPKLRCGFVCKECEQSVLAFTKPKKCEEHD